MRIIFEDGDNTALDILSRAQALLHYQNELLADYRGSVGHRVDGLDIFGQATFNEVVVAMIQAASDQIQEAAKLRAVGR